MALVLMDAIQICFLGSACTDAASWFLLKYRGFEAGGGLSLKISNSGLTPYIVSEILIRAAYAVFYLRVVPKELDLKLHRRIIKVAFWVYTAYQFANIWILLFQCGSPANVGSSDPNVVCISDSIRGVLFDTAYALDTVVDWLMTFVPLIVVYKSTMSRRLKLSVYFILCLGFLSGILALATIALSHASAVDLSAPEDLSIAIVADIVGTSESMVAILCLTLAALKPLFRNYLGSSEPDASQESQALNLSDCKSVVVVREVSIADPRMASVAPTRGQSSVEMV
ncbi:hypothetical protein ANO11243_094760 [Dothideomycetidae sp. 11243]|nr:hypothetical protein ANO11243_094760 [fungal sp. No.11243]